MSHLDQHIRISFDGPLVVKAENNYESKDALATVLARVKRIARRLQWLDRATDPNYTLPQ